MTVPGRVLIVDDEAAGVKLLSVWVEADGNLAVPASSGLEALRVAAENPPDVILLDVMMPEMDGIEVARRIKGDRHTSHIPVLVVTALKDHPSRLAALDAGAEEFLSKPVDRMELTARIRNLLKLKRYGDLLRDQKLHLEELVRERTVELAAALDEAKVLNGLLQRQNKGVIKALADLQNLRSASLGEHSRRVARLAGSVAARLGLAPEEAHAVQIAALLHDLGKMSLDDALIDVPPARMAPMDYWVYKRHPVLGQGQVQIVEGFASVGLMIRGHHENFDGTGFPDGLKGERIPLGARIIRVLDECDRNSHLNGGFNAETAEALNAIVNAGTGLLFDPAVARVALDVHRELSLGAGTVKERKVGAKELREGMTLSREFKAEGGMVVVDRNETLTRNHLEKIRNYAALFRLDIEAHVLE